MKTILEELLSLKRGIDAAKTNISKLEGQEHELFRQLKKKHGLTTLVQVRNKIKELEISLQEKETSIRDDFKKLKEEYEW